MPPGPPWTATTSCDWRVKRPRILTPLFPASLLVARRRSTCERRIVGPEQDVPWPDGAAWLDYEPKVAAVLGLETSASTPFEALRDTCSATRW